MHSLPSFILFLIVLNLVDHHPDDFIVSLVHGDPAKVEAKFYVL